MTAREKIELALRQIHGDEYSRKCFNCEYKSRRPEHGLSECQKRLWLVLTVMDVPPGVHRTFVLENGFLYKREDICGRLSGPPNPDWQEFIDEVSLLVGE